jgi:hypothetical protein
VSEEEKAMPIFFLAVVRSSAPSRGCAINAHRHSPFDRLNIVVLYTKVKQRPTEMAVTTQTTDNSIGLQQQGIRRRTARQYPGTVAKPRRNTKTPLLTYIPQVPAQHRNNPSPSQQQIRTTLRNPLTARTSPHIQPPRMPDPRLRPRPNGTQRRKRSPAREHAGVLAP